MFRPRLGALGAVSLRPYYGMDLVIPSGPGSGRSEEEPGEGQPFGWSGPPGGLPPNRVRRGFGKLIQAWGQEHLHGF